MGITKLDVKIYCALLGFLMIFWYLAFQVNSYHEWVKKETVRKYEACRIFNKLPDGEKICLEYAKGSSYEPYPFWKPLIFINPDTKNHQ